MLIDVRLTKEVFVYVRIVLLLFHFYDHIDGVI